MQYIEKAAKIVIDRNKGPKIYTDFDLKIKGVAQSTLENDLDVYEVNSGTQHIIKIELVFRTGRIYETKRASAKATFSLLREGSTRQNSEELAEFFDYYGAVVKGDCNMENSAVSLVVVERYFDHVWPVWLHMVLYPLFSDEELDKYKQVNTQKLVNALAKNDVQGYRIFTEKIFGTDHPYGYNTMPNDIQSLKRSDILDFYNKQMGLETAFMVISGRYTESTRRTILDTIGQVKRKNNQQLPLFKPDKAIGALIKVPTENAVQISIKTGKRLFPRKDPDFYKVKFMNMVLGGYFGSRLMKNIREEKGYTYGIYSSVHCWKEDGFFYISADVANDYLDATLKEIKNEINKLQESLVSPEELRMVKNYILGQSLNLLDGPFAIGHLIKNLASKDLDEKDFENNLNMTKAITAEEVRDMARRYLDTEQFTTVLAGSV